MTHFASPKPSRVGRCVNVTDYTPWGGSALRVYFKNKIRSDCILTKALPSPPEVKWMSGEWANAIIEGIEEMGQKYS